MTSHNPYDLNPFSSPVFSSFLPHHFYTSTHFLVWYGEKKRRADEDGGEEALVVKKKKSGEGPQKCAKFLLIPCVFFFSSTPTFISSISLPCVVWWEEKKCGRCGGKSVDEK